MVAGGTRQPGQHRALHALLGQRRNYHPSLCGPIYDKPFPKDWIVYIAILLRVSVFSGTFGGVLVRVILGRSLSTLANWKSGDIPHASLICIAIGLVTFAFASNRARLQAANAQLSQQVQYGRQQLEAQASELKDAFEIHSSVLPRTVQQIAGLEISCAWQPARTVSGDYFDVLALSDTRIAFCLADVSGKGNVGSSDHRQPASHSPCLCS